MGVQNDAGELLLFIYVELIRDRKKMVTTEDVSKATNWDFYRIEDAYGYLKDTKVIDSIRLPSYIDNLKKDMDIPKKFRVKRLKPKGFKIVENQQKFKNEFGFEAILASYKFSWS